MITICTEDTKHNNFTDLKEVENKKTSVIEVYLVGLLIIGILIIVLIFRFIKFIGNMIRDRIRDQLGARIRIKEEESKKNQKTYQIEKSLYCLKKTVTIINLLSSQYFIPNLSLEEKNFFSERYEYIANNKYENATIKIEEIIFCPNLKKYYSFNQLIYCITKEINNEVEVLKEFLKKMNMIDEANSIAEKVRKFAEHTFEVWKLIKEGNIDEMLAPVISKDTSRIIKIREGIYIFMKEKCSEIIIKANEEEQKNMLFDFWIDSICYSHLLSSEEQNLVLDGKPALVEFLISHSKVIPLTSSEIPFYLSDDSIFHLKESLYIRKKVLKEKIIYIIDIFNKTRGKFQKICSSPQYRPYVIKDRKNENERMFLIRKDEAKKQNKWLNNSLEIPPYYDLSKENKEYYDLEKEYFKNQREYVKSKKEYFFLKERFDFEEYLKTMEKQVEKTLEEPLTVIEKEESGVFIGQTKYIKIENKWEIALNLYCCNRNDLFYDQGKMLIFEQASNYLKYLVKIEKDNTYTLVEYYKKMNEETKKMISKVPLIKDLAQEIIEYYKLKYLIKQVKDFLTPKKLSDENRAILQNGKIENKRLKKELWKKKQEEEDLKFVEQIKKELENFNFHNINIEQIDRYNEIKERLRKNEEKRLNTKISWTR